MQLEADLPQSELPRKARFLRPVRNRTLVPLPVEHLAKIGRPSTGDPIRRAGAGPVAGATREEVDDRHLELDGEACGVPPDLVRAARDVLVRMQRVAVAPEGADRQPAALDRLEEGRTLCRVAEELLRRAMRFSRVVARAELDSLE